MNLTELALLGFILVIAVPVGFTLIKPYTGIGDLFELGMKIALACPLFVLSQDVIIPAGETTLGRVLLYICSLIVLSGLLTLSVYTVPRKRFYPDGTIRSYVYEPQYSPERGGKHSQTDTDSIEDERFTLELHKDGKIDEKWMRTIGSEENILESISAEPQSFCWYCEENTTTYLEGNVWTRYNMSQYRQGRSSQYSLPRGSTKDQMLCRDCTLKVLDEANEKLDQDLDESAIVATQI